MSMSVGGKKSIVLDMGSVIPYKAAHVRKIIGEIYVILEYIIVSGIFFLVTNRGSAWITPVSVPMDFQARNVNI